MTASILQQLLALYFAIMSSWQLSSSEKSLIGKKVFHISQGFSRFRFLFSFFLSLFFFFSFSLTNACLPYQLRQTYDLTRNDFNQFWKLKFHFEHFPRNTRFLSFDGPSNYLHLFKNHRQKFSWPGERPSFLFKVTKMWFGRNIKYLSELSLNTSC